MTKKTDFTMIHDTGMWELRFTALKTKAVIEARNIATNERLTYPRDFDRLCELLPHDAWPQFAAQMNTHKDTHIQTERLF